MSKNSVNIISVVNSNNISNETIDGDQHLIIRGVVPIVDDVVMNDGLYPAAEIQKSYNSLEGNLMPLGHPQIEGKYVSAQDVRAVNKHHVGAWAKNVRKENDKVLVDMYINRRFAEGSDQGKNLLARLDDLVANQKAEPIHVSTGLILNKVKQSGKSKGKKYSWIATNMAFDHIAILLDVPGAATPEDGVGIFVNQDGSEMGVENVNLSQAVDYRTENLLDKVRFYFMQNSDLSFDENYRILREAIRPEGNDKWSLWIEAVYPKYFIYSDDNSGKKYKRSYYIDENDKVQLTSEPVEVVKKIGYEELTTNGDQNEMKDKILAALNAANVKTEGLDDEQLLTAYNKLQAEKGKEPEKPKEDGDKAIDEKIKKAVNEAIAPLQAVLQANADKEQAAMRDAVKTKFNLSDTAVNALNGDALKEMYAQTQQAAGLNNNSANQNGKNQWDGYTLNQKESENE